MNPSAERTRAECCPGPEMRDRLRMMIQDLTVLDTQGIESRWPGFELFSTSATKDDVVESDSKFIEYVPLKLMLIFVDCDHRLKPHRRSDNCPRR